MRKYLTILFTSFVIAVAGQGICQAGIVVTWSEDVGGDLNLSIDGTWSTWDPGAAALVSTNSLLFGDNGNTFFEFNLSRGNLNGVGQSLIMDTVSGSGSVSGPDIVFGAPLPTTGYNLVYQNEGGALALEAEVATGGTFTISESFNLGSGFTLTAGTRTFSSSSVMGGETLTMNYLTAVPEPSSLILVGIAVGLIGVPRRRNH